MTFYKKVKDKYIIKAKIDMTVDEALKVLDFDPSKLGDEKALKQAYRKSSMKHHPDQGGTDEMMKKVNDAYEILQTKKEAEDKYLKHKVFKFVYPMFVSFFPNAFYELGFTFKLPPI